MPIRVNIRGEIYPPEHAQISAFDRGFLFGDSVFETCRTYGGHVFLLEAHLARLRRSAEGIGLGALPSNDWLIEQVEQTLLSAGNAGSRVRLVCSRGGGPSLNLLGGGDTPPNILIYVEPLGDTLGDVYANGVDVIIPSVRLTNPLCVPGWIKRSGRVLQITALQEGRKKGAYEVIFLDDAGFVAEGSASNVFFMRGEVLCTPALTVGILPGLTRALVLGLAKQAGVPTKEGRFRQADLIGAEEVFLTGTSIELLPVRQVEGQPIAQCVGPVTRGLGDSYRLLASRFARGEVGETELAELLAESEKEGI